MDDGNICPNVMSCHSEILRSLAFVRDKVGLLNGTTRWEGFKILDYWICIVGFGCRKGDIVVLRSHGCYLGYDIIAQLLAL